MPQKGLVGSRVVVERNHALLPPEGVPASTLPQWDATDVRILTAPAMGADFLWYQLDLQNGGGSTQTLGARTQCFLYVQSGSLALTHGGATHTLAPGGYAYLPPGSAFTAKAAGLTRLVWVKKLYEPYGGLTPAPVFGDENKVTGEPFMEMPELLLKKLLPDAPAYDMAMNLFTFAPGHGLPLTETHVMEHGLIMLQGQGLYFLGAKWHEVQADDFIWMGPFVPQSFFATGSTPARYLYYKNVARDVDLEA